MEACHAFILHGIAKKLILTFFYYAVCEGTGSAATDAGGSAATDVATPVLVASGLIVALLAALF